MGITMRIFLLLAALAAANGARAGTGADREDQFKAAYLFNFLKFVEWPASMPSDPITVCFVGADGVHDTLAAGIDGKRAAGRRLVLRRLEASTDLRGCHVLYIEADAVATSTVMKTQAEDAPLLTVSDAPGFASSGGMIELFKVDNRLRFNIDVSHAHKVGLRISSNLLQLAVQVRRGES